MIYPDSIEEKLGFDRIKDQLSNYCVSDLGKSLVKEIKFETGKSRIQKKINQVAEFQQLIAHGDVPAIGSVTDISESVEKSLIKNNWLSGLELYKILLNLSSAIELSNYLLKVSDEFPSLKTLIPYLVDLNDLNNRLRKSVAEEGAILDSASKELKTIRNRIASEEGRLRKTLNTIFRKAKSEGYVPEGATISLREGRMVIPVTASFKRQIQGFIHDESASGNIVFLEPAAVLDSNNTIRELTLAESREIKRILVELTALVSESSTELSNANDFLATVDMLWAKVKLANRLDANQPEIKEYIDIKVLKHPLLILSKDKERKVVPHDIYLDTKERIMLVSGPNAGGKSVVLKSFGLNQMMLQSGILPCCDADSSFRIFKDLFIDIGDEQSIDNDLSTYSSHLKNMGAMLNKADKDSLILIDELGSGTDPSFGGAIAEAVLGEITNSNCKGIITTHFSNLKVYADNTNGVVNAAMVFDLKNLKPLYELNRNRPGSSFSLEVAGKSGIPKDVIKKAKDLIGVDQIEVEDLLAKVDQEKQLLEEQNKELISRNKELDKLISDYSLQKDKLDKEKKAILNKAKAEASLILSRTNKEIEKTIRHIKENKAQKSETKKIRQSLKKYADDLTPEKESKLADSFRSDIKKVEGDIKAGDSVMVISSGVIAEVLELKGKKAKVLIGELQSVVSLSKLEKVSRKMARETSRKKDTISGNVNKLMAQFSPELDVRGVRANEVLSILQKFLDEAIMLSQPTLKVIHGRGNGILRELVRGELRQWPQVKEYDSEHADRGGDGITLITLK
ncbi:MAG: Smr/MutS family protein [Bacteroidota bacterium]